MFLATVTTLGCGHQIATGLPEGLREGEAGKIIVISTSEMLSPLQALERIERSPVIFVAESHTSDSDHWVQQKVIEGLLSRGIRPVLALEMLERSGQEALDRYLAGETNEEEFLEESKWKERWGYSFHLYRGVLSAARKAGLRGIALNAPREIVRSVARGTEDELPVHLQEQMPPLDSGNDAHRAYIRGFFHGHGHHGGSAGDFERFYKAQLVWDETMARGLEQALQTLGDEERLVVFAGRGHVEYGHGIPSRIPGGTSASTIVIPVERGKMAQYRQQLGSVGYPDKVGDLFWESGSEPAQP